MKVQEGRGLQVAGVGGCTYLVRVHDARKEVIDMRKRSIATLVAVSVFTALGMTHASADAPKPGASMTHIKTIAGLSAALKSAGVIIYAQGGATSGVSRVVISKTNPGFQPYSGDILYAENITKTQREDGQAENIKFVVRF